nr:FkbM family methyltransferase [Paenibacillus xylanexedens]
MTVQNYESTSLMDGTIFWGLSNEYIFTTLKKTRSFYESKELTSIEKYVTPNPVIYDIGANIGNHTLYFSKYMNPETIYAFEPVPANFDLLQRNVESNNLNNVILHNVAVGKSRKKTSVKINKNNMGECRLYDDPEGDISVIPIDEGNYKRPNLVKIDVEGYELDVLQGMINILEKSSPTIWIEINENFNQVDHFLSELEYELVEKNNFNFIYVKVKDPTQRVSALINFKKNMVHQNNELTKDKWNLNNWLASSKEKISAYEKECNLERTKSTLSYRNFTNIAEHPLLGLSSSTTENEYYTTEEIHSIVSEITNKLNAIYLERDTLSTEIKVLSSTVEELESLLKQTKKDKQDLQTRLLGHIKAEKQLLYEIKNMHSYYQLLEARYLRIKNSLPGKILVPILRKYKYIKNKKR